MRDFICAQCGQRLAFENSVCLSCHSALGFSVDEMALLVIADGETGSTGFADSGKYQMCANLHIAECNWLVDAASGDTLCRSCVLTRTRPSDSDSTAFAAFGEAEKAKRRLIAELVELSLPITDRVADPEGGLAFDLLSSEQEKVLTGHDNGVITLDLAEGDDVHREQLRVSMDEPYRTLLGHFRHEIGHYYYSVLVEARANLVDRFRALFGNPDDDYQAALDRHYDEGAPPDWKESYVSSYATMHPAEDWAETFAHYLHIRDTLDTAAAFALAPATATIDRRDEGPDAFDSLIDMWLPLSWSLNMVNRSMGHDDLYPFVLPQPVLDKMRFIHETVAGLPA